MRHVRRWPRVLLVLSAVVWMLVGAVAQIHHATVAHTVCPEHGETLDVGGSEAAAQASEALTAAPAAVDAHDACAVPSALPSAVVTERAAAAAPDSLDIAYVSAGASTARLPSPLAYAPKTSPPPLG